MTDISTAATAPGVGAPEPSKRPGRRVVGIKQLECLGLTAALGVAIVNPGTGYLSGFFVGAVVSALIWLRNARSWQSGSIDVVAAIAIALVLLSPYWHAATSAQTSPSHGAAVSMIFFIAVRIVVTTGEAFRSFLAQIGTLCSMYAAYFLANAVAYDDVNSRAALAFANANYTGAVLAFGGATTLYLVAHAGARRPAVALVWSGLSVLQAAAIYESGSRASFGGLLLAGLVLASWRATGGRLRTPVQCLVVVGFFFALIPNSISIFTKPAELLAGAGTFARGDAAENASGREGIWLLSRQIIDDAPISGWGPGNYYVAIDGADPSFLSHTWGMEYLLSVGLLGTVFIAAVLAMSYRSAVTGRGALWTAASALSVLPSLMLSTHQWTLWAWLAFALWSRAAVLNEEPEPSAP